MSVVRDMLPTKILIVRRTKQNMLMFVSSCAIWGKKKLRFIKNQEVSRLLNIPLWITTPVSNVPLIGDILF